MEPDKRPGSGTRYDRSRRQETPEAVDESPKKPEGGALEWMRRKWEDLRLGNDKLREQVAEAETRSHPDAPERPEDVTIENAYRLSRQQLEELLGPEGAPDAMEKLTAWKAALERIKVLPKLDRAAFDSDLAYRRALAERNLAHSVASNADGFLVTDARRVHRDDPKFAEKDLDPNATFNLIHGFQGTEDKSSDAAHRLVRSVAADVARAGVICGLTDAKGGDNRFGPAMQEIFLDVVARSKMELRDADTAWVPPRVFEDRTVVNLLTVVDSRIFTIQDAERIAKDKRAEAYWASPERRVEEAAQLTEAIEHKTNELFASTSAAETFFRSWDAYKKIQLLDELSREERPRPRDGRYDELHLEGPLTHSEVEPKAFGRLADALRQKYVAAGIEIREMNAVEKNAAEAVIIRALRGGGMSDEEFNRTRDFWERAERRASGEPTPDQIAAKASELMNGLRAVPDDMRQIRAEDLLLHLDEMADDPDGGTAQELERYYPGYRNTPDAFRTLRRLVEEKLKSLADKQ